MDHASIAEARALDCDAQEGRKLPSCASQSIGSYRNIGRPRFVTSNLTLVVFRAITAFRCESDDSESDLAPLQEEVIVGANCGSLLSLYLSLFRWLKVELL